MYLVSLNLWYTLFPIPLLYKYVMPVHIPDQTSQNDERVALNFDDWFKDGSYAYFVSIQNYQNSTVFHNLSSPHNDVERLRDVLAGMHNFAVPPVDYTTAAGETVSLPNPLQDATKQQLLHFVNNIQHGSDSRILIYFACHGITEESENGRPEGYLIPYDAEPGNTDSYVKMTDVYKALLRVKCKHQLIVLDCCYAGALKWAQKTTTRGSALRTRGPIAYNRFAYFAGNKAKQVITSTADDQTATDVYAAKRDAVETTAGGKALSPFASSLIKALATGVADSHTLGSPYPDGLLTAVEIGEYVKKEIQDEQLAQIPAVWNIGDYSKGEFIFKNPTTPSILLKKLGANRPNPFKGLESYTAKDRHVFFGRQRILDRDEPGSLINVLKNYDVIVVYGASGCGKSSLIRAGVLPLLGYDEKNCLEIRPGATPYTKHQDVLTGVKSKAGQNFCLFIDQYEELISVCSDVRERNSFELALKDLSGTVKIVIAVRSDFKIHFNTATLCEAGNYKEYSVPSFTRDDIKEIVTGVAEHESLLYRASYDEGMGDVEKTMADEVFTSQIIDDAAGYPDSLPLLSLALSTLFKNRATDAYYQFEFLTQNEYERFNGVAGIIQSLVEDVFARVGTGENKNPDNIEVPLYAYGDGQKLLLQIIFRMISFDGGERTKRRVYTRQERNGKIINELDFGAEKNSKVTKVCEELVNARLLKQDRDGNNNAYVEPAHEALLRSWPRLSNLLIRRDGQATAKATQQITNQDKIVLLRQLSDIAITSYTADAKNRKDQLWVKDPRLQHIQSLQPAFIMLNAIEGQFVQESAQLRQRRKRQRTILLAALCAISTAVAIYFSILNKQVRNELAEGYVQQSLSENNQQNYIKSLFLAVEALGAVTDDDKRRDVLLQAQKSLPYFVYQYSKPIPKGNWMKYRVTKSGDKVAFFNNNTLQVVETQSGESLYVQNDSINSVSFNSLGNKLLVSSKSGIYLVDLTSRSSYIISSDNVTAISFFKGDAAFIGAIGKSICRWDLVIGRYMKKNLVNFPYVIDNVILSNDESWYGVAQYLPTGETVTTFIDEDNFHNVTGSLMAFDLIDAQTNKEIYSKKEQQSTKWFRIVQSRNGKMILVDGIVDVDVFDISKRKIITHKHLDGQDLRWLGRNNSDNGNSEGLTWFRNFPHHSQDFINPLDNDNKTYVIDNHNIHIFDSAHALLGTGSFSPSAPYEVIFLGTSNYFIISTENGLRFYKYCLPQQKTVIDISKNSTRLLNENSILYIQKDSCRMWNADESLSVSIPLQHNHFGILTRAFGNAKEKICYFEDGQSSYIADFRNKKIYDLKKRYKNFSSPFNSFFNAIIYRNDDSIVHIRKSPDWRDYELPNLGKTSFVVFAQSSNNVVAAITNNGIVTWDLHDFSRPLYAINGTEFGKDTVFTLDTISNSKFIFLFTLFSGPNTQNVGLRALQIGENGSLTLLPNIILDANAVRSVHYSVSRQIGVLGTSIIDFLHGTVFNSPVNTGISSFDIRDDESVVATEDYVKALGHGYGFYRLKRLEGKLSLQQLGKKLHFGNISTDGALISPDQKTVACYLHKADYQGDTAMIYDIESGKFLLGAKPHSDLYATWGYALFFSSDSRKLDVAVRHFDSSTTIQSLISVDLDIPPALFKLQAQALTGLQYNTSTGELEDVPVDTWQELKNKYEAAAKEHYQTCAYKAFNTWALTHPDDARLIH